MGCKQFSVGFPAQEDSGSTATSVLAVNGMDPPDLGFSPAEANAETAGRWHHARALVCTGQQELKSQSRRFT